MVGTATAAMVLSAALSTAKTHIQPVPVDNLYHAAGYIESIDYTSNGFCSVDVELTGFGMPYDGHVFAIDLSADDMTGWMEEQGSIAVNDRVFCWMDSNSTAMVLDDIIDHISK